MEGPFPGRNVGLSGANPVVDVASLSDSASKFERRAGAAGQDYTQSASQAGDQWTNGFEDFASALESLSLQPRGPRGSEANFQRSRAVGEALHNERQG